MHAGLFRKLRYGWNLEGRKSHRNLIAPTWKGKECTDGVWEHATRGHGETGEVDEQDADHVPTYGNHGCFGVFVGNWGGKWKKLEEDDYMNDDIWAGVCQVILLQEVEPLFWGR